jgi:hypothetical protein
VCLPLECRTASPSPAGNGSMHFVQSFAPPAYQHYGYTPSSTFTFDPSVPPYHGLPQMPHLG